MHRLIPHPDTPPGTVEGVTCQWQQMGGGRHLLTYTVEGAADLVVPHMLEPGRSDDLWRTTCFELFLRELGGGYCEFNFSPSRRWAAYNFTYIRDGRTELALPGSPAIQSFAEEDSFTLRVTLAGTPEDRFNANIAAVIEETNGTVSYWALLHTRPAPDFHHPNSFGIMLPYRAPRP
jgi:hypothetical protein